MYIEYTGSADVRTISKKDFSDNGHDHEAVKIETVKTRVIEVPEAIGEWLIKVDRGFKEATQSAVRAADDELIDDDPTPARATTSGKK